MKKFSLKAALAVVALLQFLQINFIVVLMFQWKEFQLIFLKISKKKSATIMNYLALWEFCALIGAVLGDIVLGNYKITTIATGLECVSSLLLSIISTKSLEIRHHHWAFIISYFIGAAGKGLCSATSLILVMEQFPFPKKYDYTLKFIFFYTYANDIFLTANLLLIPYMRKSMGTCFTDPHCYVVSFYYSLVNALAATIIYIACWKKFYKLPPIRKKIFFKMIYCVIFSCCAARKAEGEEAPKDHWLDYGEKKFGRRLVEDVKRSSLIIIYIPLILVMGLMRSGSGSWESMAMKMVLVMGSVEIPAEFIFALPSIFNIVITPTLFFGILPLLKKYGYFATHLRRIGLGIFCIVLYFIITGILNVFIEKNMPTKPKEGHGHIRIYNTLNCHMDISFPLIDSNLTIGKLEAYVNTNLQLDGEETHAPLFYECGNHKDNGVILIGEKKMYGYYFNEHHDLVQFLDDNSRNPDYQPRVRTLIKSFSDPIVKYDFASEAEEFVNKTTNDLRTFELGECDIYIDDEWYMKTSFLRGGVYAVLVSQNKKNEDDKYAINIYQVTSPNSLSFMWTFPAYVIYAMGEFLLDCYLSIFTIEQAPMRLKATYFSLIWINRYIGRNLYMLMAKIGTHNDSAMSFINATVAFVCLIFFIIINIWYKYYDIQDDNLSNDNEYKEGYVGRVSTFSSGTMHSLYSNANVYEFVKEHPELNRDLIIEEQDTLSGRSGVVEKEGSKEEDKQQENLKSSRKGPIKTRVFEETPYKIKSMGGRTGEVSQTFPRMEGA